MKITPLAAESMGTRSMATFVEGDNFRFLIDPGASLAASRYHLPPHALEKWRLKKHKERIRLFADKAQVIIITCFHSDHCFEDMDDIFKRKLIFMQNPNVGLHVNRRKTAFQLINRIKGLPLDIIFMDDRMFQLGDFRIVFSKPVKNCDEEKKESVISVVLKDDQDTFLFSSNIEGHFQDSHHRWMLNHRPNFLYIDGPTTYFRINRPISQLLELFNESMKQFFNQSPVKTVILDHHITRDPKWQQKIKPLHDLAKSQGIHIQTAAEYRGEKNDLLEARRQELYRDEPSSQ